jgi:hypothetical protein
LQQHITLLGGRYPKWIGDFFTYGPSQGTTGFPTSNYVQHLDTIRQVYPQGRLPGIHLTLMPYDGLAPITELMLSTLQSAINQTIARGHPVVVRCTFFHLKLIHKSDQR